MCDMFNAGIYGPAWKFEAPVDKWKRTVGNIVRNMIESPIIGNYEHMEHVQYLLVSLAMVSAVRSKEFEIGTVLCGAGSLENLNELILEDAYDEAVKVGLNILKRKQTSPSVIFGVICMMYVNGSDANFGVGQMGTRLGFVKQNIRDDLDELFNQIYDAYKFPATRRLLVRNLMNVPKNGERGMYEMCVISPLTRTVSYVNLPSLRYGEMLKDVVNKDVCVFLDGKVMNQDRLSRPEGVRYIRVVSYIRGNLHLKTRVSSINSFNLIPDDPLSLLFHVIFNMFQAPAKSKLFLNNKEILRTERAPIGSLFDYEDFTDGVITGLIDHDSNLEKTPMYNVNTRQQEYFVTDRPICEEYLEEVVAATYPKGSLSYVQCNNVGTYDIFPAYGKPRGESYHYVFCNFREKELSATQNTVYVKMIGEKPKSIAFDIHKELGQNLNMSLGDLMSAIEKSMLGSMRIPGLYRYIFIYGGTPIEKLLPMRMNLTMLLYYFDRNSYNTEIFERLHMLRRKNPAFDPLTKLPNTFDVLDLVTGKTVNIQLNMDIYINTPSVRVLKEIEDLLNDMYKDVNGLEVTAPINYIEASVDYFIEDLETKPITVNYVKVPTLKCKRGIFMNGPGVAGFIIDFSKSGLTELSTIGEFQRYVTSKIGDAHIFLDGKNITEVEYTSLGEFSGHYNTFDNLLETETFEVVLV